MQAKKLINLYTDIDIDIIGITLLSKEEYLELQSNIKQLNDWWWLSSPGYHSLYAPIVDIDGSLSDCAVLYSSGSVRPVLIHESKNLSIGDTIYLAGKNWTVISDKYILCDERLCLMSFRKDWKVENANEYQSSDIKKYLDDWFNENIQAETL